MKDINDKNTSSVEIRLYDNITKNVCYKKLTIDQLSSIEKILGDEWRTNSEPVTIIR